MLTDLKKVPFDAILFGVNQHCALMNLDYFVAQDREICLLLREPGFDAPLATHHRDLAHIYTGIVPDYGLSSATALWMADFMDAKKIIIAGCDNYSASRRYWHSPLSHTIPAAGLHTADVWHLVKRQMQHPERVFAASGPLTEIFQPL